MAVVPRAKPFVLDLSNTDDLKIVLPKVMHDINFMLEELYSDLAAVAAQPIPQLPITEANLSLSDVTTDNVSIARHGFVPKLPNDSTKFLNGVGAFAAVSSGLFTIVQSAAAFNQNNFAPGLSGNTIVELSGNSPNISGLAGGTTGAMVILNNTGTSVVTLLHNSTSSNPGNRFINTVTSGATPLAPGGYAVYLNDGTNYYLVGHEQGPWITPTYNGANYTADVGTWTVDSGDVTTLRYRVSGNTLFMLFSLETTSVSSTPSRLSLTLPNGYSMKTGTGNNYWSLAAWGYDNNVQVPGFRANVAYGSTTLDFYRFSGTWSPSTNLTYIYGGVGFDIK